MKTLLARVQETFHLCADGNRQGRELGTPFLQAQELKEEFARPAHLNIELNIDDRTPM